MTTRGKRRARSQHAARARAWPLAALLAALGACGVDEDTGVPVIISRPAKGGAGGGAEAVCTPGKQEACACLGGVQGIQVCKPDGSGFDPCLGCPAQSGGAAGHAGSAGSGAGNGAGQAGSAQGPGGSAGQAGGPAGSAGKAGAPAGSAGNGPGAGQGGACGGLLPTGTACAACASAQCCEQGQACAGDDDCKALALCLASCHDTSCTSGCLGSHPAGLAAYEPLGLCLQGTCSCADGSGGSGGPGGGGAGGSGAGQGGKGGSAQAGQGGSAQAGSGGKAGSGLAGGGGSGGSPCDGISLPLLLPECVACAQVKCCNDLLVCASSPECVQLLECFGTCSDNACFNDVCVPAHPAGVELLSGLVLCDQNLCPEACTAGAACGGVDIENADCKACTEASCCDQSKACSDDPGCEQLYACASHCSVAPCVQDCEAQFPTGVSLYESLKSCQSQCPCDPSAGPTCKDIVIPDGPCRQCATQSCCPEGDACAQDKTCFQLWSDLSFCHGDAACEKDLFAKTPPDPQISGYSACLQQHCGQLCDTPGGQPQGTQLGVSCAADADCKGFTCLLPDGGQLLGGGPAGGYCSADCTAWFDAAKGKPPGQLPSPSPCEPGLDLNAPDAKLSSVCVNFAAEGQPTSAFCMRRCDYTASMAAAKCLGRTDAGCQPITDAKQTLLDAYCRPLCQDDKQCAAGYLCDRVDGVCKKTITQGKKETGAICALTSDPAQKECVGECRRQGQPGIEQALPLTKTHGYCASDCVFGFTQQGLLDCKGPVAGKCSLALDVKDAAGAPIASLTGNLFGCTKQAKSDADCPWQVGVFPYQHFENLCVPARPCDTTAACAACTSNDQCAPLSPDPFLPLSCVNGFCRDFTGNVSAGILHCEHVEALCGQGFCLDHPVSGLPSGDPLVQCGGAP